MGDGRPPGFEFQKCIDGGMVPLLVGSSEHVMDGFRDIAVGKVEGKSDGITVG